LFITITCFISCKTTRHVKENDYLLNKLNVKVDNKKINTDDINRFIRQKPNRRILYFFPFHLSVYNYSQRGKTRKWKDKIGEIVGEEPVIYEDFQTTRSVEQINKYLKNKGFYSNYVSYDTITNKKKLRLIYNIEAGSPTTIKEVSYNIIDEQVRRYVLADTSNSLIKKGEILDIDKLQNERLRITRLLSNKGYYAFAKEFITFNIDTLDLYKEANIILIINSPEENNILKKHNTYEINSVNFFIGYNPKKALELGSNYFLDFESIEHNGYRFFFKDELIYNPNILIRSSNIKPGFTYVQKNVSSTYRGLTSLRTFRLVNIQFSDTGHTIKKDDNKLDCFIMLSPLNKQSYQIEAEGTHSSGNIGVGGNLIYQNRNLFKNAEMLDVKLRGAIERQTLAYQENEDIVQEYLAFNSIELGAETKIHFHTFLFPFVSERFKVKHHPKTNVSLAYNFQQRPDFSRTISQMGFGYYWEGLSTNNKHSVNLLNLNYVKLPYISWKFRNSIRGTFLEGSYTNHMVISSSYTYTLSDQKVLNTRDFIYLRYTAESAGNLINPLMTSINYEKNEEGQNAIKNTPIAQYAKTEIDFRYYKTLWFGQRLVYRGYAAIGYPYGNMKVLPFEKLYFAGGANGIRAWPVRTLGPGSFKDTLSMIPNQTGDIKLEANLEYRFKFIWVIEGAIFLDGGNIWDIYSQENRQGGVFKPESFYNDIALGTGLGLRFDFSFFVFRFDLGLKLRDPIQLIGSKYVINKIHKQQSRTFNFGIGYPF